MHRVRPQRSEGVRPVGRSLAKAEALASISRRTVRDGRPEGGDWCGGTETDARCASGRTRNAGQALFAALPEPEGLGPAGNNPFCNPSCKVEPFSPRTDVWFWSRSGHAKIKCQGLALTQAGRGQGRQLAG